MKNIRNMIIMCAVGSICLLTASQFVVKNEEKSSITRERKPNHLLDELVSLEEMIPTHLCDIAVLMRTVHEQISFYLDRDRRSVARLKDHTKIARCKKHIEELKKLVDLFSKESDALKLLLQNDKA